MVEIPMIWAGSFEFVYGNIFLMNCHELSWTLFGIWISFWRGQIWHFWWLFLSRLDPTMLCELILVLNSNLVIVCLSVLDPGPEMDRGKGKAPWGPRPWEDVWWMGWFGKLYNYCSLLCNLWTYAILVCDLFIRMMNDVWTLVIIYEISICLSRMFEPQNSEKDLELFNTGTWICKWNWLHCLVRLRSGWIEESRIESYKLVSEHSWF